MVCEEATCKLKQICIKESQANYIVHEYFSTMRIRLHIQCWFRILNRQHFVNEAVKFVRADSLKLSLFTNRFLSLINLDNGARCTETLVFITYISSLMYFQIVSYKNYYLKFSKQAPKSFDNQETTHKIILCFTSNLALRC